MLAVLAEAGGEAESDLLFLWLLYGLRMTRKAKPARVYIYIYIYIYIYRRLYHNPPSFVGRGLFFFVFFFFFWVNLLP
jgi:hypothetical protein